MDEFLEQFILESREQAQQATSNLLTLEKSPADVDCLDNVFRAFHTIKGGAGIVEFDAMVELVHGAESSLAEARSGQRTVDKPLIDSCLRCVDQVLLWLDLAERSGGLPDESALHRTVVARGGAPAIDANQVGADQRSTKQRDTAKALLLAQLQVLQTGSTVDLVGRVASAGRVASHVALSFGDIDGAAQLERVTRDDLAAGSSTALTRLIGAQIEALQSAPQAGDVAELVLPDQAVPQAADDSTDNGPAVADAEAVVRTLRVDVGRIDALVRLTGELTVAGNAIGHLARLDESDRQGSAELLRQRHLALDRLIGQLQRAVLGMRVLPLRQVFQRFQRLARELSLELGKTVELKTEGGETEADKAIVEMLFEPLLHVLRNSMDHGIESPAQRRQLGKPAIATVRIHAYREGDNVMVDVVDDGKGVDVQRVRALARERKLFSDEVLDAMTEHDVVNIIFQPGFSTSTAVTNLSGRGVGMDAVRVAVERFGGRVGMHSRTGQGATVRFTLPFSALMTRIMVVAAGGQRFGLPFEEVIETVQVGAADIVDVGTSQAVVLRNRTVPVIDLAEVLSLQMNSEPADPATLVVVRVNGQSSALRVDRIGERLDVMLYRLDGLLMGMPGIAASTLLGDGGVLLVLDLAQIL